MSVPLSSAAIRALNAQQDEDTFFFEAVSVVRDSSASPVTRDYFANVQESFTHEGATYLPAPGLEFADLRITTEDFLPRVTINLSNLNEAVTEYLNDDTVIIFDNEIRLQIFLRNLALDTYELVREEVYFVQIVGDDETSAQIIAGIPQNLDHPIPSETLELNEFFMLRGDVLRAGT